MRSLLLVVKDNISIDKRIFERLAYFRPLVIEDNKVIDKRISERLAQFNFLIIEDNRIINREISKRLVPSIIKDNGIIDGGKSEK